MMPDMCNQTVKEIKKKRRLKPYLRKAVILYCTSGFTALTVNGNRNSALRPRISPPTDGNPSPTYHGHALAVMIGNYRRHAPFVALVTQCVQKQQQSDIGGHLWILLWLS
ncbi:hypothetical protein TNCV_1456201 [Trichonephila clavipes]|nr:hypothetical protein TNCV_1456201 [Trichonephila clavipes]